MATGVFALKANALVDEQVIDAPYRASQAGVRVEVVVRGICAMEAGAQALKHRGAITGRFPEHPGYSTSGRSTNFIGSADMMHRNLDRRVEVMAQVKDPETHHYLDEVFESAMDPSTRCWTLGPDGNWTAEPRDGRQVRDHQVWLMQGHRQR